MEPLPPAKAYSRRERFALVAALFVVSIVYLASFLYLSHLSAHNPDVPRYPIVVADSTYYTLLSDSLLYHQTFSVEEDLSPAHSIVPGYPFFLSVVKYLTGSFTPAVLIQSVLGLCAVLALYAMARRLMPRALAFGAAILYALSPMVAYTTTTILTDTFFSSLLIIIIYLGFFQSRFRGIPRAAFLGLLIGSLAMTRLTGVYLLVLLPIFFTVRELLRTSASREEKRPFLALGAYLLCALILTMPWAMRNHELFGTFSMEAGSSHGLLDYNVKNFLAWRQLSEGQTVSVYYPARHQQDPVFVGIKERIDARYREHTPAGEDRDRYTSAVALSFIAEDPFRYAYFHLAHVPAFLFGSGSASYIQIVHQLRDNDSFSTSAMYEAKRALGELLRGENVGHAIGALAPIAIEVPWWMLVSLLALIGWVREWRRVEVWLFAALIGFFAIVTGSLAIARYRIPAEPYLLLLAALGINACVYYASAAEGRARDILRYVGKIMRYVVSGGSAFVASVGIFSALVYGMGMWYVPASVVAFLLSFVVSFILQKFFAFRDIAPPKRGGQILRYALVLCFNTGANTLMLFGLVEYVGLGLVGALAISNIVIAIWNFFIYDHLIFHTTSQPILRAYMASREALADLSVIIPCHNEEASLAQVIREVPSGVREIIVVDNNSSDATAAVARTHGATVVEERRRGYGAAVTRGLHAATGSVLAVIDGDHQHPAEELPRMLGRLTAEGYDFLSGARFPLPLHAPMSTVRRVGNWGLTLAANLLFNISLNDSQSGMVLFKRRVLHIVEPRDEGVVFVQEMKIRAARSPAVHFGEYPIPCIPRLAGVSKVFPFRHGTRLLIALILLRLRGLKHLSSRS